MTNPEIHDETNVNGVPWYKAPIPRWWHRCKPWTTGRLGTGNIISRCACGAMRINTELWFLRNQRRAEEKLKARYRLSGSM